MARFARLGVLVLAMAAVGCSHFGATDDDYRHSRSLDYLKPPEGVEIPRSNYVYRVPEGKAGRPGEDAAGSRPVAMADAARAGNPAPSATGDTAKPAVAPKQVTSKPAPAVTGPATKTSKPAPTQVAEIPDLPVFVERQELTATMPARPAGQARPAAVTTANVFVVDASPEKVWGRLVGYWMARKIPLIESNPQSGRIRTDWIPAIDPAARARGIRDQFEVSLQRDPHGSRITLKHRASRKAPVKGNGTAWALLGTDPALQAAELARLRDYLTGGKTVE